MRILVTGAAGFIGHHMVEHLLKNTDWSIVILDKLTYASSGKDRLVDIQAVSRTLADTQQQRIEFHAVDLSRPLSVGMAKEIGPVDYILHMAAETHVDNSIGEPWPFVEANVIGTYHMLEYARKLRQLKRFVYFSTDEVFGPAPSGVAFKEWDRYRSANPYAATKAAGEELCIAWANTYQVPAIVTHCMNAYGERQHPEKFIPTVVRRLLQEKLITVHADPTKTKSGSRFYIHCRNIADAVLFLLRNEEIQNRDKFNIVGEKEITNLDLVHLIKSILEVHIGIRIQDRVEMVDFHSSRPGHDLRYALDGSKMQKLGWTPPVTFEQSLAKTVQWMVDPKNIKWLLLEKEEGTHA